MDEQESIVRELAASVPIVDCDLGDYCWVCGKVDSAASSLTLPDSHEPECLWRRAKSLYPDSPSAQ